MKTVLRIIGLSTLIAGAAASCSNDKDDDGHVMAVNGISPEETGSVCEVANDCFSAVGDGGLHGDALCLTRVRDGYCTHTCEVDSDCCATPGECTTNLAQVCSPFESTDTMMCFLSCGDDILAGDAGVVDVVGGDAGVQDQESFCQRNVSPDFICRSSGGGTLNRKICVPGTCGVGADCVDDSDCNNLDCIVDFAGGYCGSRDCTTNADCPNSSLCVTAANGNNYCYKSCGAASDCSFCRHDGLSAACSDDVTFAEDGTTGSVCVPSL